MWGCEERTILPILLGTKNFEHPIVTCLRCSDSGKGTGRWGFGGKMPGHENHIVFPLPQRIFWEIHTLSGHINSI